MRKEPRTFLEWSKEVSLTVFVSMSPAFPSVGIFRNPTALRDSSSSKKQKRKARCLNFISLGFNDLVRSVTLESDCDLQAELAAHALEEEALLGAMDQGPILNFGRRHGHARLRPNPRQDRTALHLENTAKGAPPRHLLAAPVGIANRNNLRQRALDVERPFTHKR